jgi:hypothetical protein
MSSPRAKRRKLESTPSSEGPLLSVSELANRFLGHTPTPSTLVPAVQSQSDDDSDETDWSDSGDEGAAAIVKAGAAPPEAILATPGVSVTPPDVKPGVYKTENMPFDSSTITTSTSSEMPQGSAELPPSSKPSVHDLYADKRAQALAIRAQKEAERVMSGPCYVACVQLTDRPGRESRAGQDPPGASAACSWSKEPSRARVYQ